MLISEIAKNTQSDHLLIHLPVDFEASPESSTIGWVHIPAGAEAAQCPWQHSTLSELPTLSDSSLITVLIPTEWLLLSKVDLPQPFSSKQRKQLLQALPFLVEEQLAADIEEQHLAISNIQNQQVDIAVIERQRLQNLLACLQDYQLAADALIPDALTLPINADNASSASLLLEPTRASLRTSANTAVSIDQNNLAALLDSWEPNGSDGELTVLSTDAARLESHRVQLQTSASASGIDLHITDTSDYTISSTITDWQTDLNLLQGEFAATKKQAKTHTNLRLPAIAASVGVVLYVGYLLASGMYFSWQADKQYQDTLALYRSYFPSDRRIVNVRTQTRNHLSGSHAQQGDQFLNLLGQFIKQWQPQASDLQMQQIRFNRQRSELIIELNSKSIDQLDQLRNQLSSQGLNSELLSAIEENQGIRGRIKLTTKNGGQS
ncbi:hypothetical protein R50073_05760 [Maricurvus nonylphenolicus]|uniref:type II secretion system protein GspL n=1 Tax=Maricurvus nonylphenolicus TaxID=1008307 RepID=UPI0036F3EFA0